jgi:predicted phosphoribosyltransferase
MLVRDRAEAGRQLAQRLDALAPVDPVVLGLPRGGVPVAYEIARTLDAPLDVIVVRKLGVPHHEELAMGAIGEGDIQVVDRQVLRETGVTEQALAAVHTREDARLTEQAARLRRHHDRLPLRGHTVILVDDGIATGSSMLAACRVARAQEPTRVVIAVPVAPQSVLAAMADAADEVVCLHTPHPFMAVGLWYHDFSQVTDDEVIALLDKAARRGG